MAKMSTAKRKDETEWEFRSRLARVRQEARDRAEPIVPVEAERHGDYQRGFVTHVETATKAHTMRNYASDPVKRWEKAGALSTTQLAAIELCRTLWERAGIQQRVTANYGERLPPTASAEDRSAVEIDARRELHRMQDEIPAQYWSVFENICRFGLPIGVTASAAGYVGTGAELRARTVVCFVADLIAMRRGL